MEKFWGELPFLAPLFPSLSLVFPENTSVHHRETCQLQQGLEKLELNSTRSFSRIQPHLNPFTGIPPLF